MTFLWYILDCISNISAFVVLTLCTFMVIWHFRGVTSFGVLNVAHIPWVYAVLLLTVEEMLSIWQLTATTRPAVCIPSQHAPCKALLCLRRCVKGSVCGRYVLERSVNARTWRAALWNTWVTLSGVILALAGEHGAACMRNVSKLAECLYSLATDPENALSYFSNIICKNCKTEVKKKRVCSGSLHRPPCARVLWHEPSKQCVSDRGGRHATEYALTDPRALNTTLALRSFCNIKDVDVTFTTNTVHQARRVRCSQR